MTTRAGLRSLVRSELNDTAVPQLWLDLHLNQWLLEAIRCYSIDFPRETSQSLTSVAGQEEYSLASDCRRVARVEHPAGFFRTPDRLSSGQIVDSLDTGLASATVSEQLSYDVWGPHGARVLSLWPAPSANGESVTVRYLATWSEPSADADTLATPPSDDQLLVWLVCARALRWIATDESKRQRYERDRGASADGQVRVYQAEYQATVAMRDRHATPRRLVVRQ
jgi:hypothetical protein